jgi:hypothetical protein
MTMMMVPAMLYQDASPSSPPWLIDPSTREGIVYKGGHRCPSRRLDSFKRDNDREHISFWEQHHHA